MLGSTLLKNTAKLCNNDEVTQMQNTAQYHDPLSAQEAEECVSFLSRNESEILEHLVPPSTNAMPL